MRTLRLLLCGLVLTIGAWGLAPVEPVSASHAPAMLVCAYFKPHTGDTTDYAIWHYIAPDHNSGIAHCRASHPFETHFYTVYWGGGGAYLVRYGGWWV